MADSLREQAWRFVCATFPERQIYIRSDGRVQFFTFGPLIQAILAGGTLAFLGWVAFTSVNVVFKDHIIASKDKRYQQMQASYETRVTDLQLAYDTLNSALVTAEDTFKAHANELENKQRTLSELIHHKQALTAVVSNNAIGPAQATPVSTVPEATGAASDSLGSEDDIAIGPPGSSAAMPPAPAATNTRPAPRSDVPALRRTPTNETRKSHTTTRSSFFEGAVQKLAGAFFGRRPAAPTNLDHPALRQIALETTRLNKLDVTESALTDETEQNVSGAIAHLDGAMHMMGIEPAGFVTRTASVEAGIGGPLIPLSTAAFTGVLDRAFNDRVSKITDELEQLSDVVKAMRGIPLTTPVQGPEFGRSSGFGARIDPFTKRLAFHAGLDFTGPWGSTIHATAPGVVIYAGPRGAYGNAVEIDHGMGIKTRYGHLSAILVKPGTKVDKGSPIGKLGSSGRSTGPHVHYEVWYDQAARDPTRFIKAGQYVLQE